MLMRVDPEAADSHAAPAEKASESPRHTPAEGIRSLEDISHGHATISLPGQSGAPTDMIDADTLAAGRVQEGPPSEGDSLKFTPGTLLRGRYEILELLGTGGMGAVYSATDRLVGQAVALKFVRPSLAKDLGERDRLRSEVRLMQTVTHLNVARTYTMEETEGHLFIVMEILRGKTLAARLKEGPIALEEALRIARDLLSGLSAAHGRGVIHRDIKPLNIKLCDDGRVAIMDFGLARISEVQGMTPAKLAHLPSRDSTSLSGTPGYIAPEIARGAQGDARLDLYAVGVVLFEMLVGKPPFTAQTPLALLQHHLEKPPPDLGTLCPSVPPYVVDVVRRLLAKDPDERFATADDVRLALDPGAASSRSLEPLPASSPKQRVTALVVAALLACVATWAVLRAAEPEEARSARPAAHEPGPPVMPGQPVEARPEPPSPAPALVAPDASTEVQVRKERPRGPGLSGKAPGQTLVPVPTKTAPIEAGTAKRRRLLDLDE
jgi:hypothetical protein